MHCFQMYMCLVLHVYEIISEYCYINHELFGVKNKQFQKKKKKMILQDQGRTEFYPLNTTLYL